MKKQKKVRGLQGRKAISGYLFIMPFIVGFLMFMVKPLIQSLYMSFFEIDVSASGLKYSFVKIANYLHAFQVDPEFSRMLVEDLGGMVVRAFAVMVFSFFVALILNREFKGRALVRAIFFLPVILSSGAILGVDSSNALLAGMSDMIEQSGNQAGVSSTIQDILVTTGIGSEILNVVFDIVDGIYDVAIASGIQIIIFLSGLQTISPSMYEAAEIEGCTKWESLWKITFPMISSLMLVNWIYTVVDYCMRADSRIIEKINDVMVVQIEYGIASAMAWSYFLVVMVVIGISSLIISKGVYYYE